MFAAALIGAGLQVITDEDPAGIAQLDPAALIR
jgi:hypothetical protein